MHKGYGGFFFNCEKGTGINPTKAITIGVMAIASTLIAMS
jgi:hypothetical protein